MARLVTLGVGVVGSTVLGSLVTDGWYARYVLLQLPSQSWSLRWIWDFWLQDLVIPFAVTLVVVGGLVRWSAGGLGGRSGSVTNGHT